jgi:hypothetical protein
MGCTAEESFGDVGGETAEKVAYGIDDDQLLEDCGNYNRKIYYIPLFQLGKSISSESEHYLTVFSLQFSHHSIIRLVLYYIIILSWVIIRSMSRYFYRYVKDYLAKYRTKTREKRISLMNYLRVQR